MTTLLGSSHQQCVLESPALDVDIVALKQKQNSKFISSSENVVINKQEQKQQTNKNTKNIQSTMTKLKTDYYIQHIMHNAIHMTKLSLAFSHCSTGIYQAFEIQTEMR